jgi:hypothetical protein
MRRMRMQMQTRVEVEVDLYDLHPNMVTYFAAILFNANLGSCWASQ